MRRTLLIGLLVLAGCADEKAPEGEAPRLTAISSQNLVIGETVEFYGEDLLIEGDGTTRLRFAGDFEAISGQSGPVDVTLTPTFNGIIHEGEVEKVALLITRFGPYANPFTRTADTGTFRGKVTPILEDPDGMITEGAPLALELKIGPSITIESLAPFETECGAPALRAFPGMPYVMRVRVSGLAVTHFRYEISNVNGYDGATIINHDYDSPVASDALGEPHTVGAPVIFNPVPVDQQAYVSAVRVIASDDKGEQVETALPLGVHRPMEVIYTGAYELAQRYEPEPVMGCMPGSIDNTVSYSEQTVERRQQTVSVTVNRAWTHSENASVSTNMLEGIQAGVSSSSTLGGSNWEGERMSETQGVSYSQNESTNVNYSSSDGESWSWNTSQGESNADYEARMSGVFGEGSVSRTVEVSAEGSVPGFAKVTGSVGTTVGVKAGARVGSSGGQERTQSSSQGFGMSGSSNSSSSFGSATNEGRSESISGTFALSSGSGSNYSDTEARNNSRVWNVSQGESLSSSTSERFDETETSTWTSSESLAIEGGYIGNIPASKSGMFYRQVSRYVKRAEVRSYDLCGLATHVGELRFDEWVWAADLAIGRDCLNDPPKTNLPDPQCYLPPCDG